MAAFSDDPEKVAACVDIMRTIYAGAGNELTGELPTSRKDFDTLKAFQEPIFATFRKYMEHARAAPGPVDLPVALERDAGGDRQRPDRVRDARGSARQRGRPRRADLRAAERKLMAVASGQWQATRQRRTTGSGVRVPEQVTWLAPLLTIATLFFLWPVLNVIRLAFTDTTLLREGYSYTTQTLSQTLTDPALPKTHRRDRDLRRRLGRRPAAARPGDRADPAAGGGAQAARGGAGALRGTERVGDAGHPDRRRLADRAQRRAVRARQLGADVARARTRSRSSRTPSWRSPRR